MFYAAPQYVANRRRITFLVSLTLNKLGADQQQTHVETLHFLQIQLISDAGMQPNSDHTA